MSAAGLPAGSEVDGERAKFEAWAKDRAHPFHDREPLLNNGAIDRFSDIAWQAWQAALSTRPQQAGEVPAIDYPALIAAGWQRHQYRQGTRECVAFKNGAEWFREQCAAIAAAPAGGRK